MGRIVESKKMAFFIVKSSFKSLVDDNGLKLIVNEWFKVLNKTDQNILEFTRSYIDNAPRLWKLLHEPLPEASKGFNEYEE